MTASMADDKKATTTAADVVVIRTTDQEYTRDTMYKSQKSRFTKRQVILAVTGVVVLALVIAGILLGVWFYLDAAKQLVERKFELDTGSKKVDWGVTADLTENIVQYHTKEKDSESWIINDFNRELQVIKSRQQTGYTCYIRPLNRSKTATPEFIQNVTGPTGIIETTTVNYQLLPTAIKDKTMLGKTAQTMCDNLDVYWIEESCEQRQNGTGVAPAGRQKRYTCWFWYLSCCTMWRDGWLCTKCEAGWIGRSC